MESRTNKSIKNIIFSVAFQFVTVLANFSIKTALIKFLGIQYAGVAALFTDVLSILSMAELGFSTAIGYALYGPLHRKDEPQIAKLMHFYKKIYRVVAAIVMGAGILCMPFLGYIIKGSAGIEENITVVFAFFVIQTASSYLLIYRATLLEANQQKSIVCGVGIIFTVIATVIEVLSLVVFKKYLLYLTISVIMIIVKNIAISLAAQKQFPILREKTTERLTDSEKKEITKDIKALAIYKIGHTIQVSTASIIISTLLGTVSVGLLSTYRLITNNIDKIFGQVFEAMKPSVGNLAVSESKEHQYDVFKRMCFLSFLCGNFIAVAAFVLINPFITLWLGEEYLLGMGVPLMLVLDMYILTMARPYEAFRIANRLFLKGKYRPIVMTVINLILSVIFGRMWGIFGVLLSTVLARTVTHVWYDPWLIYRNVFKVPFFKYLLTKGKYLLTVSFNCAFVYYIASAVNTGNLLIDFIIKVFIAGIIPTVIVIIIYFNNNEMKWFIGYGKSILNKIKRK